MAEQEYFKKALSHFTYDIACKGAIQHLADQGYTIKQIIKNLDFPVSYEKVQHTVWEHFCHTGILLSEEPGNGTFNQNATFIKEYDKYGKPSFRKVVTSVQNEPIYWREKIFQEKTDGSLASYLNEKKKQSTSDSAYLSCDFGIRIQNKSEPFLKALQNLTEYQRDYILGLPWEKKILYHKINYDIIKIVAQLYEFGEYSGYCYFIGLKEKIKIERKNKSEKICIRN